MTIKQYLKQNYYISIYKFILHNLSEYMFTILVMY